MINYPLWLTAVDFEGTGIVNNIRKMFHDRKTEKSRKLKFSSVAVIFQKTCCYIEIFITFLTMKIIELRV